MTQNESLNKFKTILTSIEDNIYKIVLNRPKKKNAFNRQMYLELEQALTDADSNVDVLIVCITGAGDYFSSGNDLSNFTEDLGSKTSEEIAQQSGRNFERFVNAFIDFSKPIIGIVNGPSVGISFTLLALFDLVYANENATFYAPFTKLGLIPEACSSYLFPKLMGRNKASEVLMFDRKLTANEAYERNIVTEVIKNENFHEEVWNKIRKFSKLPKNSLLNIRKLIRGADKEKLKKVNKQEVELIIKFGTSEEAINALFKFFSEKSKL